MKDHIAVCICTFHRNQMLERLLRKLAWQETDGRFDLSVVVVDNDSTGPAHDTVMHLKSELGIDIDYAIEEERTIPAARNHALRLAHGNYVAIIDDDEFPPQNWLITLYRAIVTFDVDGALGPVHPFFDQKPPSWLLKGRLCERPVQRTGTLLEWRQTRTGNVLLKKDVFDGHSLRFDPGFRTSSSDNAFFKKAMKAGCKFIAVEEAPVYESVPPERWKKNYYFKRALAHGYNAYQNSRGELHGLSWVTVPLKAAVAVLAYTVALPLAACLGGHWLVKCLRGGGFHLSWLLAMLGIELIKTRNF